MSNKDADATAPSNPPPPAAAAQILLAFARREYFAVILGGCLLGCMAGLINGIALIGYFASSVSHMTGNVSLLALSIAEGDYVTAYHLAAIIAAFMFGAFVSGAIVGGATFRLGRSYGIVLMMESMGLFGAYMCHRLKLDDGAYFAAFACGLQNAMVTNYSGAIIRTTHVTGTTTDIALILGQCLFHQHQRQKQLWKLQILVPVWISFWIGGMLGFATYGAFGNEALLLPCCVEIALGIGHLFVSFGRRWWLQKQLRKASREYGHNEDYCSLEDHINDVEQNARSSPLSNQPSSSSLNLPTRIARQTSSSSKISLSPHHTPTPTSKPCKLHINIAKAKDFISPATPITPPRPALNTATSQGSSYFEMQLELEKLTRFDTVDNGDERTCYRRGV